MFRIADAFAQDEDGSESRKTGRDMDDGSPREIERTEFVKPSIRVPDPVSNRIVDQGSP